MNTRWCGGGCPDSGALTFWLVHIGALTFWCTMVWWWWSPQEKTRPKLSTWPLSYCTAVWYIHQLWFGVPSVSTFCTYTNCGTGLAPSHGAGRNCMTGCTPGWKIQHYSLLLLPRVTKLPPGNLTCTWTPGHLATSQMSHPNYPT